MNSFIVSCFFGIIGTGYFVYGKKRPHGASLACGILLCVYPYFVSSLPMTIIIGIVLMVLPFKIEF